MSSPPPSPSTTLAAAGVKPQSPFAVSVGPGEAPADPSPESSAPETAPPAPPRNSGWVRLLGQGARRYEILGEEGRGGLGRVLRARDTQLGRLVALKELHDPTEDAKKRFLREVMLTARLQHPSIVGIYEIGEKEDGAPFYAMKLVSGRPLDQLVADQRTLDQRIALLPHVTAVAEAIAYAHDQGIIHRDLKPSNVVVGAFGETVVIDWGLAKDLHDPTSELVPRALSSPDDGGAPDDGLATRAGEMLGTPAYMPPEQMRGESVDERADVFAIGALLYHVLSGHAPYDADSFRSAVSRIVLGKPKPLRERTPLVPRELAAIVDKAMQPDPALRYRTAKELATDLGRYQTGQLVLAESYGPARLALRFLRKHRLPVALSSAFVVALAAFGSFTVWRIVGERDRAEKAKSLAEARSLELTMLQARTALDRDPTQSVAWLLTYPTTGPEWGEVASIAADAELRGVSRWVHPLFPSSWVKDMRASPDGRSVVTCDELKDVAIVDLVTGAIERTSAMGLARWVAFANGGKSVVSGGEDGSVFVYDRATRTARELPVPRADVRALEVLGAGDRAVVGGQDGALRLVDLGSGRTTELGRHDGAIQQLAASPDGAVVASVGVDATLRLWDVASGRLLSSHAREKKGTLRSRVVFARDGRSVAMLEPSYKITVVPVAGGPTTTLGGDDGVINGIDLDPTGSTVASSGFDKTVHLWDVKTRTERHLHGHAAEVEGVRFSPDGTRLASASGDGEIRIWDVATGQEVRVLRGHTRNVVRLVWSPETRSLASSDQGGIVRVWSMDEDPQLALRGHTHDVVPMMYAPDGRSIASGSNDRTARLWDVQTGKSVVFSGHTEAVRHLAFANDGRDVLVTGSNDHTVRVWPREGGDGRLLTRHEHPINQIVATPRGPTLVTASQDALRVLDLRTSEVRELVAASGERGGRAIALSADGTRLGVGGFDRKVRLFDVASGREIATLGAHEGDFGPLRFSPDGTVLASGSTDNVVRLWDLRTMKPRGVLTGHTRRITSLAFSPDGQVLVSGSNDASVRAWDVATATALAKLPHDEHVGHVAFSPDGTLFASSGNDREIRVWDRAHLRLVAMHRQDNVVTALDFAPDGRHLASAGWDQNVRVWPVDASRLLPTDPEGLQRHLAGVTNARVAR